MNESPTAPLSLARRFVVWVAAAIVAMVATQTLGTALRRIEPEAEPGPTAVLTLLALLTATAGCIALPRRVAPLVSAAAGALGLLLLELIAPGSWRSGLSLPFVGAAVTLGAVWLAARIPEDVDHTVSARRGLVILWVVMSLVSVVQMGRLSTRMADWSSDFTLATRNPFWHTHECLPAYLYGGELAERGDPNVYDASHYPGLDRDAAPETQIVGMTVEDPYQYPPQFLLIPKLALGLSRDYETLRVIWFAGQFALFSAVFVWLALSTGGRAGRAALWLLPGVLVAFPMLHGFQFGQIHLSAVAVALGGMLAFQRGRRVAGGFLLASAILAKLFPAILLVPMLVNRKYRDLAWTGCWAVAITLVSLIALGPQPFEAFVDYQIPRLANGAAFAFGQAWPEVAELLIIDNQGAFGLSQKLGVDAATAAWVGRAFALFLLGFSIWVGLRMRKGATDHAAITWLALLGMASLASPGAWGDYIPSVAIWLIAMLATQVVDQTRWATPLMAVATLQYFVLGTMPIGDWTPLPIMTVVSALGAVGMLGLFFVTPLRYSAPPDVARG